MEGDLSFIDELLDDEEELMKDWFKLEGDTATYPVPTREIELCLLLWVKSCRMYYPSLAWHALVIFINKTPNQYLARLRVIKFTLSKCPTLYHLAADVYSNPPVTTASPAFTTVSVWFIP